MEPWYTVARPVAIQKTTVSIECNNDYLVTVF